MTLEPTVERTPSDDAEVPDGTAEVSVLVVDDHSVFTDLVTLALDSQPGLRCVGVARDRPTALEQAARLRPDLVLMDVNLRGDDGLAVAEQLLREHPHLRVVVLTAFADVRVLRRAAAMGACAVLPKDGSFTDLVGALRHARPGNLVVHDNLLRLMVSDETVSEPRPHYGLTAREQDVLDLMARGRDVPTIAAALDISVNTCRTHLKHLMHKLGVHSQVEAVALAHAQGLVRPE